MKPTDDFFADQEAFQQEVRSQLQDEPDRLVATYNDKVWHSYLESIANSMKQLVWLGRVFLLILIFLVGYWVGIY